MRIRTIPAALSAISAQMGTVRKRIISVFHNEALLRKHTEALQSAGHEVCQAHNIPELREHLEARRCDIIVIGPMIPPQEKLRIANFAKERGLDCTVIEVYESSPELAMAHLHIPISGGHSALVDAVAKMAS